MRMRHPSSNRVRVGLTLVELMVALAVISVLAAIALPNVKSTLQSQRVSRAASLLKSSIEEGRARSIRAGGGGGIIIDRIGFETAFDRSQSLRVRLATTPAPYTGDVGNSTAKVGVNMNGTLTDFTDDTITLWFDPSAAQMYRSAVDLDNGNVPTLINLGDRVNLADARFPMTIIGMQYSTDAGVAATLRNSDGLLAADIPDPHLFWTRVVLARSEPNQNMTRFIGQDVSFSITRSPRAAISLPTEMPTGTVIDLSASGVGRYGNEFSPMAIDGNYLDAAQPPFTNVARSYSSIFILFGARGEVSRLFAAAHPNTTAAPFNRLVDTPPTTAPPVVEIPITGDIHFLVGHAGETKVDPGTQLEEATTDGARVNEALGDEAKDGTTPLLNPESMWVTIRARNGEVVVSSWIDPTDDTTSLIPDPQVGHAGMESRIRTVIGRTRREAVSSNDAGSI